jgi:hypothetical protein
LCQLYLIMSSEYKMIAGLTLISWPTFLISL